MSSLPGDSRQHPLAFRDSPVASFLTDLEGAITAWNGAAAALLGRTEPEVLGRPFPGDELGSVAALLRAAAFGVKPPLRELTLRHPDGPSLDLAFEVYPLRGDDGAPQGVAALVRDLGPERRAAERLAAGPPELQVILDTIPVPVFHKDAAGIYRGCNVAFEHYIGRTRAEIVGRGVEGVAPPELAAVYRAADQALLSTGGTQVYETRVRYADGTLHDVLFNKAVLRDARGQATGLVGSMLDLTERRRAEEALLLSEHRLELEDRLATVGTLAAGVGHEINNPLAALVSSLNFVQANLGEVAAEVREALDDALVAASRVSRVVRDLRGFSRLEDELVPLDLAEVLRSTLSLAREEVGRRARLAVDLGPLPPVLGNGPRLAQVFLTLLAHAAQSMPERPSRENEVLVRARHEGIVVTVEVRDNGVGIPPAVQAHLFDPFYISLEQATGKGPAPGPGLGLAICHRVVTGLGGDLEVRSAEGVGTVFRVQLRVAEPEVEPAGPA